MSQKFCIILQVTTIAFKIKAILLTHLKSLFCWFFDPMLITVLVIWGEEILHWSFHLLVVEVQTLQNFWLILIWINIDMNSRFCFMNLILITSNNFFWRGYRIHQLHPWREVRPPTFLIRPTVGHGWWFVMLEDSILEAEYPVTCSTPLWLLLGWTGSWTGQIWSIRCSSQALAII